jgi:glycosyltransferase involved in cell wall biosynthesis
MSRLRVSYVLATAGAGTGYHAAMLAEGAARRGMSVAVFGPAVSLTRFFPAAYGAAIRFGQVEIGAAPHPVRDAAAVRHLRRLLAAEDPQIVHAHGTRAGAFAAAALGSAARRPPGTVPALVVTMHNAPPEGRAAGLIYRGLERFVAARAGTVLCVSEDLADRMRRLGARETGRALVPAPDPGPPTAEAAARARADLDADARPVILAAGRLAPQKGFDVLLAAASAWQNRSPRPVLAMAGQGPLAGDLAAQAAALGVEARFLGARPDVPALLAAATVVVVPSRWEGQPLFVQEALRAGRPLIATRVGGIPDLTGDDAALLVPAEDPAALREAVLSILDNPALATGLASAARERAATLPSEDDAVQAALARYERLAAGSCQPS